MTDEVRPRLPVEPLHPPVPWQLDLACGLVLLLAMVNVTLHGGIRAVMWLISTVAGDPGPTATGVVYLLMVVATGAATWRVLPATRRLADRAAETVYRWWRRRRAAADAR